MRPPIRTHSAVTLLLSALLAALAGTPVLAVLGDTGLGSGAVTFAASSATVTAISASSFGHTCVVTSDGTAWCWGDNSRGELGDGTTTERLTAVQVTKAGGATLSGVTLISAGGRNSTCAVTKDGAAWCWGDNSAGELGDGTTVERDRAVRVTKSGGGNLTGVTSISTGGWTLGSFGLTTLATCAVTKDGAAWCWGNNFYGQLGDGTTTARLRAVRVRTTGGGNLAGVTAISTGGNSSCARTRAGAAWCWGLNAGGQLGDGTTTARLRAVRVTKAGGAYLTGVATISAGGFFTCADTTAGAAWCWGDDHYGELGNGSTTDRHWAVRVTKAGGGSLTGVTDISALGFTGEAGFPYGHACATTSNGGAWCWGYSSSGELGDGTTADRLRAVRVAEAGGGNLTGVIAISTGNDHTCARTIGGTSWCWGGNYSGALGDGTTTDRLRAVPVTAI
jgi:alpha-tubulin suppressor-like RCC1 family protein